MDGLAASCLQVPASLHAHAPECYNNLPLRGEDLASALTLASAVWMFPPGSVWISSPLTTCSITLPSG
ncbi:hypothetical protein CesoFtcFv8_019214 [Champsocephalus esox]|uniref:Uncharacterized protein n=1 Tax=Champsocephalus esox TaxID=159716 RepID=A0AAN8BJ03_9TELE|nr:hypothetical protein CesoFtcFv8_019214 [Champsocephalus esox]